MIPQHIPIVLVASLLLSGCNLMPNFELQTGELPNHWRNIDSDTTASKIDPQWWQAFGSPQLNRLITEALAYNNDLASATQRIAQARAQSKIASANLWPVIGMDGNIHSQHDSLGETRKKTASLFAVYEVDLWGANRGKRDAGQDRYLSTVFARDALRLVIMAEVSQAYFDLAATSERVRIAQAFLQNVRDVLNIVEAKFQAGAVSALDLAQQKTELASTKASLVLLQQQQSLTENTLSILLGRPPADFQVKAERFADLNLPSVQSQQPYSLLLRRPDLQQAEMQLKAANIDVGITLSAFYPSLQINLDTILANPQPAGLALAMAANLAQPLFQGGRLEGGLEYAKAHYAELMEIYQQTLLVVFKEVEDAAAVRNHSSQRLLALSEAVARAREAYQISFEQYRVGAIDYQTLLNTQRSLISTENTEVLARLDVMQALVQLYKAFGGGWQNT